MVEPHPGTSTLPTHAWLNREQWAGLQSPKLRTKRWGRKSPPHDVEAYRQSQQVRGIITQWLSLGNARNVGSDYIVPTSFLLNASPRTGEEEGTTTSPSLPIQRSAFKCKLCGSLLCSQQHILCEWSAPVI